MAGNLTAMIASIFSGSAVTADPHYKYTTLLLPGNGTNGAQNNTFLDGSTNNFTITRNGNTTQGTFSPFSQTGWGNYFNGSSTLDTSNAAFNPAGAFTIEFWFYGTDSATATQGLVSTWASGLSPAQGILIWKTGANCEIQIGNASTGGTTIATFTWATYLNQWNHFALVRNSSNSCAVFLNGTRLAAPVTKSGSPGQTALTIGRAFPNSASSYFTGYMSNVSFVSGSNVYDPASSTITVPTTPLSTSTTNQALLTCQANRFIDSNTATTAKTITLTGSPSVQAFSPFNPTASWSAATYGGSGYFDGSGDYLTAPSNAAFTLDSTGDFTVECWIYPTASLATSPVVIILSNVADYNSAYTNRWGLIASGSTLGWLNSNGGFGIQTSTLTLLNTWTHVAVVRSGSTITMYVNGVASGTQTTTQSYTTQSALGVGYVSGATAFPGYISNARVVKGTAVYTSNFTPPTAPLTAITNTSLLLNFTNAGIYDATSKNDLETVGNAKISTTQSKWGGSSISFDGTGDWLLIPDQPPQRIGTGNFTIEMWVYRNSSGTYGLAGKGTGTTGWLVSLNSSNQVVFTYGSSTITSSGTVSATTWTHIAVVREGTSTNQTKIYIGGTNDGTGTVSTDFNQTNSMYIGADRTGGSAANAYVQDVRITNYARYTANFTPPTAAFPTL